MKGVVIKSVGSNFSVRSDEGSLYSCKIKGTFRLKDIEHTNPVAVGDHVLFDYDANTDSGVITEIEPRKNYIIRKSNKLSKQTQILAANIDKAILIVTPEFPKTSTGFIDRFIATAEAYHIETILVFNKSDLFTGEARAWLDEYLEIYQPLGYVCIETSSVTNAGISLLKDVMKDNVSLLAGHSGTGKSTLINQIQPSLNLKVGQISGKHLKGMHTTTFAEMFPLDFGGFIIDTPGIRELGTVDFNKTEISHYFVEMRDRIHQCKYNNCTHTHESGCAVKQAFEEHKIHPSRYRNYISILENEDVFN